MRVSSVTTYQISPSQAAKDPTDAAASQAHWERILADPTVIARTIVVEGVIAGHIAKFEMDGDAELTYWIGRAFWGKGIATRALRSFLDGVTVRPIHARVAFDNVASMRVLEKCGFVKVGESTWFANARNAEIIEFVYKLG